MKIFAIIPLLLVVAMMVVQLNAASINCDNDALETSQAKQANLHNFNGDGTPQQTITSTTTAPSLTDSIGDVKVLLKKVQCSLERAKPIVVEIEKEAKRLEASAKRFGERVFSRLGNLMDRFIVGSDGNGGVKSLWTSFIGGGVGAAGAHISTAQPIEPTTVATTVTVKEKELINDAKEQLVTEVPPSSIVIDVRRDDADLLDNEIPSDEKLKHV